MNQLQNQFDPRRSQWFCIRGSYVLRQCAWWFSGPIIKTSDAKYFVVKAPNNPKGSEFFQRIARKFDSASIRHSHAGASDCPINSWLVSYNDEMKLTEFHRVEPWQPGLCFGSRIESQGWYPICLCPFKDQLYDHQYAKVVNLDAFHDVLMFDLWAMQTDKRQAVFLRPKGKRGFVATMIDQGFCFGGSRWGKFQDARYRTYQSTYRQPQVYDSVYGIDSFEPIINRMRRKLNLKTLRDLATQIPREWIDDRGQFDALLGLLDERLCILEELVNNLHDSVLNPFRNWEKTPKHRMRSAFEIDTFEDVGLIPPLRFEEPMPQTDCTLTDNSTRNYIYILDK